MLACSSPSRVDHMGPKDWPPGSAALFSRVPTRPHSVLGEAKGAPWHPHRGFETVTYLVEGEFMHRDSMGSKVPLVLGLPVLTAFLALRHSVLCRARFVPAMCSG